MLILFYFITKMRIFFTLLIPVATFILVNGIHFSDAGIQKSMIVNLIYRSFDCTVQLLD